MWIFDKPYQQLDFEQIVRQRRHRLTLLGYRAGHAAALAGTTVDIDMLERLIRRGCPRDTAVRIAR